LRDEAAGRSGGLEEKIPDSASKLRSRGEVVLSRVDRPNWPEIESSLWRVKRTTGERWSVDFVIDRIQSGDAGLFEFIADDNRIAVMVVEGPYGSPPVMNVWILEGLSCVGNRDEMIALIDDLARSIGAKSWKLESPRRGWARMLRGYITRTRTVYERDLT
jgi:hypothetical protein